MLSGQQFKQLHTAFLSAFPTIVSLEQLVALGLDQNLNAIASGGTLSTTVFQLLQWAEATGRTQELIEAAYNFNPGNPLLRRLVDETADPISESELPLSGTQIEQFRQALQSAFPSVAALRRFLRIELNENLATITGETRIADALFELIVWAESRGRTRELAELAYQTQQDNLELQSFVEQFLNLHPTSEPVREPDEEVGETIFSEEQIAQSMMRIDQLVVENFRCFEYRKFDLAPQFNVLIGDNGAGKTAALEAFAIAISTWLQGLDSEQTGQIRKENVRRVGGRIGEDFSFEEHFPVTVFAKGQIGKQELNWQRSLRSVKGRTTLGEAVAIRQLASETFAQVRTRQPVILPVIAYYGSSRLWHQPRRSEDLNNQSQRRLSRFEGYRNCMDERINSDELMQWMLRQDRITYQEQHEPKLYRVVRQAMQKVLIEAKEIRFDKLRLELVVEFQNGSLRPFKELSDGQRNLVVLAGDLAMRMARLIPQLGLNVLEANPGIVLIDELDMHLHPNWQRSIVERLRSTFPRLQFIATTHSALVVQSLRQGELIDLNDDDPGEYFNRSPEDILENVMEVEMPQRSERSQQMIRTAEEYYNLLASADNTKNGHLEELRRRLDVLLEPYADNEAYVALLRQKRAAAGIDGD
ncbi:MAG: ATPase [Chthonomonadales bacterium]|nr:ATPase [Chthonomonadales bacterium]